MPGNGLAKTSVVAGGPSIVDEQRFILSTRDTGYRSTAAAAAELVDNSLQAGADVIQVFVTQEGIGVDRAVRLAVLDNGSGMDARTLGTALRFGGSSRFDDRAGPGRFGMGLPNSSVSQAKRVDVYTWQKAGRVLHAYLDVDDIAAGKQRFVPAPSIAPLPDWVRKDARSATGTLVLWDRCDRLDFRKAPTIAAKLHESLGRKFRYFLWDGVKIKVNGELVSPVDFLCLTGGEDALALPYGDALEREVRVPGDPTRTSVVKVRFSELKVAKLHGLPVEEKRRLGISKGAGVSVVRARREIDCGWYFMGGKRRENYDDWWRCEISFEPALDELFSVTHSKQGISPKQEIIEILTPTLESTAHSLNSRARAAFTLAKSVPDAGTTAATKAAAASERLLNPLGPPAEAPAKPPAPARSPAAPPTTEKSAPSNGRPRGSAEFRYRIDTAPLRSPDFYVWEQKAGGTVVVTLNSNHTFFEEVYEPARASEHTRFALECLILASVRADMAANTVGERGWNERRRVIWSNTLAALLEHV